MIINIGNEFTIAFLFNKEMIELNKSKEWSFWMRTSQNLSNNTISSYLKSMERFWVWSLYYQTKKDESLSFYLSRYREQLRDGFEIIEKISINNEVVNLNVYSSSPLSKQTITKEINGIESYFFFIEDINLMLDNRNINHLYEKRKSEKSFLSSINVTPSKTNYELVGKRRKLVKPYKKRVKSSSSLKRFPTKFFDELLSISKPRERLIYILCGACSARIGQALNLTIYDIDYKKKDIWLIDPKSDDKDIYGNKRREWLKKNYQIDILFTKPHNSPDLQFKYPIPYEYEPLHWIDDKYKNLFFKTLIEYVNGETYLPEQARTPKHPFLFVTKTGNRIRTREINTRLKSQLMKIDSSLESYSLHSLRHMFGFMCAEIYGYSGNDALISWTKNAMGHSSLDSTLIYFNMSYKTKTKLLKEALEKYKRNINE